MSTLILKGDEVRIRPEWQDDGDGTFTWLAVSDEEQGRVDVRCLGAGLAIAPCQTMESRMVERVGEYIPGLRELQTMIQGACRACPDAKQRRKALTACRWRFRGPRGEFVGLGEMREGLPVKFVPEARAQVFDGRDNELQKLTTYGTLGRLSIEILPCAS